MDSALEIARILLPILIVGGIAVFVVMRMKSKHTRGTLGKKKSKSAQSLLDSFNTVWNDTWLYCCYTY